MDMGCGDNCNSHRYCISARSALSDKESCDAALSPHRSHATAGAAIRISAGRAAVSAFSAAICPAAGSAVLFSDGTADAAILPILRNNCRSELARLPEMWSETEIAPQRLPDGYPKYH